jgi:hypothetical protein
MQKKTCEYCRAELAEGESIQFQLVYRMNGRVETRYATVCDNKRCRGNLQMRYEG